MAPEDAAARGAQLRERLQESTGDHTARLIEEAGGKGLSVGAAAVSAKHANFIVAGRDARAEDVLELIRNYRRSSRPFDIHLDTEVQLVGIYDGDG